MPCRTFISFTIIIVNLLSTIAVSAQFGGYYSTINGQSGSVLKSALNSIIDNHNSLSYTPGVWNAHKDLYEDPNNANNIILFYSQVSVSKSTQAGSGGSGATAFNREHLWPRSYGVGNSGSDNTDLHHLVPTYVSVNSSRGNKYFDYSDPEAAGYSSPAYELAPQCTSTSETFEPGDGQKGKAARAILYMTTRYDYLELINTPPSAAPESSGNQMAQLNTLLKWNRDFLPTNNEKLINQKIYTYYQGNRNPYVDYPEFADAVWLEGPSWGKWRLDNFSLSELLDSSVSGDNADPDQDGIKNLLERAMYTDPREKNTSAVLSTQLIDGIFNLSFTRAIDATNLNASIRLERSLDLYNWTTVDLSEATVNTVTPEQEIVTLSLNTLSSGTSDIIIAPAQYYRIVATNPAGENSDDSAGVVIDYETVTSGGGIDYETTTLFFENFNNTDLFTTSSNLFSDADDDYFGLTGDGSGIEANYGGDPIPSGLMDFSGASGSYMIAEDMDGEGAELPIRVTWPDININGQTGLILSADIGASINSIDSNDDLLIEYQIDGNGYNSLLDFSFLPDGGSAFNNVFELSGSLGVVTLSEVLQTFTVSIPGNGSSLDVRLTVSLNAYNESFALDNLEISAASSP